MKSGGSALYAITFFEFTITFVPFALLLAAALLAAETTLDLGFYRTVYTIWAATVLVTPALCAIALPRHSARKQNIWILFWTFAFLVYLVHLGYAVFAVYHGSFREFLVGQGLLPGIVNVLFTAWWAFDVLLAWFHGEVSWVRKQRIAAHVFIGLTFVASTVVLKHGFINVLGIAMTACVLVCIMARIDARHGVSTGA